MASSARRGKVQRRHGRTSISDAPDTMSTMAVAAGGHPILTLGHLLTMCAGHVLGVLIHPNLGVELAHVGGIAMALGADRGNLPAWDRE
jgi:hypothetical protein